MFGDGASNTGNFGETMNLAALWKLPVLFLVENNLYGMGTAVERHSAQTDLSQKAEGYGIPGRRVDGMDVVAVREGVAAGLQAAREEERPTLLEAFTYRFRGHSAADPEVYREREEVEEWREKDPIENFARRCVDEGVLGEREVAAGARAGRATRWREAVEFADASPEPPLDTMYEHLYALTDYPGGWYAVDERSPEPHRGEHEAEMPERARELAEAGAAYADEEDDAPPEPGDPGRSGDPGASPRRSTPRAGGRGGQPDGRAADARGAARRDGGGDARATRSVFVMGEDVAVFEGAFKVTEGLLDEFGERRVRDTPISENTIVGAGVGAAMGGLRPIVELMTVNFSLLALDQIVNHAAAIPYMFNGARPVPMVIRMPGGGGHQLGPTHSHSFEALYLQVPGLLVACPSTPADGKGLLKAAIRDDNPVIFIEHESPLRGARRGTRGRRSTRCRSGRRRCGARAAT